MSYSTFFIQVKRSFQQCPAGTQRWNNVDSTVIPRFYFWRLINVEPAVFQHCAPAGIVQLYRNSVWMCQEAKCSLLEYRLIETWPDTQSHDIPVTGYWHWADKVWFLAQFS